MTQPLCSVSTPHVRLRVASIFCWTTQFTSIPTYVPYRLLMISLCFACICCWEKNREHSPLCSVSALNEMAAVMTYICFAGIPAYVACQFSATVHLRLPLPSPTSRTCCQHLTHLLLALSLTCHTNHSVVTSFETRITGQSHFYSKCVGNRKARCGCSCCCSSN